MRTPAAESGCTSLQRGALLNWLSLGLHFAAALLLTPIIVRHLGPAGFGLWALIQSFSGYYGLVNLGLGSALLRFASHDLARDDRASLRATIGTATAFFSITGGLALAIALLLGRPLASFFAIAPAQTGQFQVTVALCALAVAADFFGALTTALMTARERFDLINALVIGRQLVLVIGILVLLPLQPTIATLAAVTCLAALAAQLVACRLAKRLYPDLTLGWRGGTWTRLGELLKYGTPTALLSVANLVRLRLGNVVIGKVAGLVATGSYSLASNLVFNMSSAIAASTSVLNPRFTQYHTQRRFDELRQLYRCSLFCSASLACWIGLLLLVCGDRFILLWVGDGFRGAVPTLKILTCAYVVALAQSPGWNLMFALSRHHLMAAISAVEAVVIVCLGIWLAAKFGAVGFAGGIAAAMLVTKLLIQPLYSAHIGGLRLFEYLQPMLAPFSVALALWLGALVLGAEATLRHHGVAWLIFAAAALSLLFVALVLFVTRRRDYVPRLISRLLAAPRVARRVPPADPSPLLHSHVPQK